MTFNYMSVDLVSNFNVIVIPNLNENADHSVQCSLKISILTSTNLVKIFQK